MKRFIVDIPDALEGFMNDELLEMGVFHALKHAAQCQHKKQPTDEQLKHVGTSEVTLAEDHLIEAAREEYGSDSIEIDDPAASSHGNDGVWIAAWVFLAGQGDECEPL